MAATAIEDTATADLTDALKNGARILHREARAQEPNALERLRALPDFAGLEDEQIASEVRRRHCLTALAQELGFRGWSEVVSVLEPAEGSASEGLDFGTLLYPHGAEAHWNIWSASYDQARAIHREHGGYLLAYRRQFFVADRHFIETLGLDPEDPNWELIARDWARQARPEARGRLYEKLIRRRVPGALAPLE